MLSKAAQYHKLQMRKKGLTEEELEPLDDKNDNALAQGRVSNGAGRARERQSTNADAPVSSAPPLPPRPALIIVFDLSNPDSFHKARSLLDFVRGAGRCTSPSVFMHCLTPLMRAPPR